MEWISVKDRLPKDGEYVYIYASNYSQRMKYDVARFVKGLTIKEREDMKNSEVSSYKVKTYFSGHLSELERYNIYQASDEHGNNKVGYNWETFGAMSYFGQDVTHWMPLPEPPKE